MLDINIKPVRGVLFVRLKGILNKETLGKLQNEVSKLIKDVGIKNIVFNINELSEIDYDGMKELFKNYDYCTNHYGKALFVSEKSEDYKNSCFKNKIVHDERSAAEFINT